MANEPVIVESGGGTDSPINPKTALLIIISIVIVILLLFYYFYKKGQSGSGQPFIAPLPYDTPSGTQTAGAPPGASASQQQLSQIAATINQLVNTSIFSFSDDVTGLSQASELSNTDLVALNNTYNQLYYPQGGGSLLQDLQGLQSFWEAGDANTLAKELAGRLQSLTNQTAAS
jgi:hypothetical protein